MAVTEFALNKSFGSFVVVKCTDGEIVKGRVANFISSRDNPRGREAVIEINRKTHYIVLRQREIESIEILDSHGNPISLKPTLMDRITYFMLGRDVNK